jgi:hypothetical protein
MGWIGGRKVKKEPGREGTAVSKIKQEGNNSIDKKGMKRMKRKGCTCMKEIGGT